MIPIVTCFNDTLKSVKAAVHKKVTLSLPEPLLRQFRGYAASRNQSVTQLLAEAIRVLMDKETERLEANRRILARMENARDLGTGGATTWTRDQLHER